MNRIDDSYASGLVVGHIEISDDDFQKIEKEGRIKLSVTGKEGIIFALTSFRYAFAADRNASSVYDQLSVLRNVLEFLSLLKSFVDPRTEDHSYSGPMMRVRDCIYDLEESFPENINERLLNNLIKSSISETELRKISNSRKENARSNFLDVKTLTKNLNFLEFGIREAICEIETDHEGDKGGPNTDHSLNELLIKLRTIYDASTGKKGAIERFCTCVIRFLPQSEQPSLPEGHNSIVWKLNALKG